MVGLSLSFLRLLSPGHFIIYDYIKRKPRNVGLGVIAFDCREWTLNVASCFYYLKGLLCMSMLDCIAVGKAFDRATGAG